MSTTPIRVAVFTPHSLVGAGLSKVMGASGGRFALATFEIDGPEPDVALYDVALMAKGDTTALDILVSKTAAPVMLIGSSLRPDLTAKALSRGADGFFDLDTPIVEILAALESATTGWEPGDEGENPTVGSSSESRTGLSVGTVGLNTREQQVLELIAQGYSNQEIADQLYLGANTIKTYIRSLYRKIGATNRATAVGWAIEHGLPSR